MNILGHLYLSKPNSQEMLGNFIADFVKGKKYLNYSKEVQQGILLHRKIDEFTDNHPITKVFNQHFKAKYRLYSGVITDIVYDHFLASNWEDFHTSSLSEFAKNTYHYIEKNSSIYPDQVQQFIPYMIQNNWLVLYSELSGIHRVLNGMSTRTSLPNETNWAMDVIQNNYEELKNKFYIFLDDVRQFALDNPIAKHSIAD